MVWLLVLCHLPGAFATDTDEQTATRARELLTLSDKQNFEDHSLALQTAQQSLDLWQSLGDNTGVAQALAQIARCYHALSNFAEASQNYQDALLLWRQQDKVREQAETLIQLGYVEEGRGDWLNTISYLTQAQALINEQTDPDLMGRISSGLAGVFNDNGMPETALLQYQRALNYFRLTPDPRDDARMTMAIGYTYLLLGDHRSSLSNLEEALASFKPGSLDAAECHEYIAQLEWSTGEFAGALRHLEPSLKIYENANNPRQAARVRALIGQTYSQQGMTQRARASYVAALGIFRRITDKVSEAAVCFALGRLELNAHNFDAAEDYLKQSIADTENIRNTSASRDLTTAISASVHDRYAAYIDCLIRKHKLNPSKALDVVAFQASELVRARSLAEFLRETQTRPLPGLDPRLAEQDRFLRLSIRAKLDQRIALLSKDHKQEELNQLETTLAGLNHQHQQLTEKIRGINPLYSAFNQVRTHSLEDIQRSVIEDDKTVLLEYLLGKDASYVWLITRNDLQVYELPGEKLITEATQKVYDLLSKEPDTNTESRLQGATNELAQMILAPLADRLQAQKLLVVADGALNYIPFQLLPDPSHGNEPLISRYEIVNAPSASILKQLREEKQQRRPPAKLLAAFGDPAFPSDYAQTTQPEIRIAALNPNEATPWRRALRDIEVKGDSFDVGNIKSLLYTRIELNNLRAIAGADSLIATGFDASRKTLENTDLTKYAILHLATHGILDPKRPELSGFFLSMVDASQHELDGFMTVQDVYSLNAPVDLVVLSACRTALGKDVRGEGLIGLTRGFMHAGASSVAASLWKVDDEATAELMKEFYANMLQKGMTPGTALRAAQNTIRGNSPWQSPHFWAAFTIQGEYKETIKVAPARGASQTVQMSVGAGLLLLLVAGIGWGYWRRRGMRAAGK